MNVYYKWVYSITLIQESNSNGAIVFNEKTFLKNG